MQNTQFAHLSTCHTTVGDAVRWFSFCHLNIDVDDGHINQITLTFYDGMANELVISYAERVLAIFVIERRGPDYGL